MPALAKIQFRTTDMPTTPPKPAGFASLHKRPPRRDHQPAPPQIVTNLRSLRPRLMGGQKNAPRELPFVKKKAQKKHP